MDLYDGNQLPENLTSNFQMLVSIWYTLMMVFFLSLGGFAAWATSHRLTRSSDEEKAADGPVQPAIGQSKHPSEYMSDLVRKRNAIVRGLLAFIPTAFSLAHLYTGSLHSSRNYGTGQVVYAALVAFAASYMGKTLQQLVLDSDHMDTTKAVYESLYMLASSFDRLSMHKPARIKGIFCKAQEALPEPGTGRGSSPAWRSHWVLFNVFLAIGAQDDARIWPMFSVWLSRFQLSNFLVYVPKTDNLFREIWELCFWPTWWIALLPLRAVKSLLDSLNEWRTVAPSDASSSRYNVAYACWLFSQDKHVRTITGSMVVKQGMADEVTLAGCRSRKLYYAAEAYVSTLSAHVVEGFTNIGHIALEFVTRDNKKITYDQVASVLSRIYHKEQAATLSMVCERYVCRHTPAFAALCLPTHMLVPRLYECWQKLNGCPPPKAVFVGDSSEAGYWCRLWLAYMHLVLVGLDLLRMDRNKPYFEGVRFQQGFMDLLRPEGNPPGKPKVTPAEVELYMYDLSDADMYGLAAYVATVLLRWRMWQELLPPLAVTPPWSPPGSATAVNGTATSEIPLGRMTQYGQDMVKEGLRPTFYDDYLQRRSQLVHNHSSLPAIVQGIECFSAAEWVDRVMDPVKRCVALVGITAVVIATIACSKGVFLVAVCGAVQSFAAWALLLHTDRLPERDVDKETRPSVHWQLGYKGLLACCWLLDVLLRPLWLLAQVIWMLVCPPNWILWSIPGRLGRLKGWLQAGAVLFGSCAGSMLLAGGRLVLECFKGVLQSAASYLGTQQRVTGDMLMADQAKHIEEQAQKQDDAERAERTDTAPHGPARTPVTQTSPPSGKPKAKSRAAGCCSCCSKAASPPDAALAEQASFALAAAVSIAATATRAVETAGERGNEGSSCRPKEDEDWEAINVDLSNCLGLKMGGSAPSSSSTASANTIATSGVLLQEVEVLERSAIGAAFEVAERAAADRASAQPNGESYISGKGTQKAVDAFVRIFLLLSLMKWRASKLFLQLSDAGVSLQSCFESECKRFYRNRISAWNTAIKFITPLFFYTFLIFIVLAVLQENWYVHEGMCLGRCLNGTDCWADQNLGLPGADNALGRWLNVSDFKKYGVPKGPPVCPGTGSIAINQSDCQLCPWMESVFKITVLRPVRVELSGNTTLCKAEVLVVNMSASDGSLPPSTGTPIPAMWQSMYGGENQDNSSQVVEKAVSVTNRTGYASFTSPVSKPFNASSGYGCNLTVLAASITGFAVHPSSLLNNSYIWNCTDCTGDWVATSPCDALCESNGTLSCVYHIKVQNNTCGKPCPATEGQNKTASCSNPISCNCEGKWLDSRACDASCQSWGSKTMTFHVYRPTQVRWVNGTLVRGAECEAKDMQTKEESCFNNTACPVSMHADVYSQSGSVMHGDLVQTEHVQP